MTKLKVLQGPLVKKKLITKRLPMFQRRAGQDRTLCQEPNLYFGGGSAKEASERAVGVVSKERGEDVNEGVGATPLAEGEEVVESILTRQSPG
jgi:hypothetical protein